MNSLFYYLSLLAKFNWIIAQYQSYSYNFIISPFQSDFESHYKLFFESTDYLCLGNPPQCLKFFFNPSIYTTAVFSQYKFLNETKDFDPTISKTYHPLDDVKYSWFKDSIATLTFFNDLITFRDLEIDVNLLLLYSSNINETLAEIGLQISNDHNFYVSFLEQLINKKLINDMVISINFLSNSTGRIYFGKNDTFQSLIESKPTIEIKINNNNIIQKQIARLEKIYIGNKLIDSKQSIIIDESIGFIQMPVKHINNVLNSMFSPYIRSKFIAMKKKIKEDILQYQRNDFPLFNPSEFETNINDPKELIDDMFNFTLDNNMYKLLNGKEYKEEEDDEEEETNDNIYLYLLKKIDYDLLKKINELSILFRNGTLILLKENTFRKYDETHMILTIAFINTTSLKSSWIIGQPILMNYIIQHDLEHMTIRLYQKDHYVFDNIIINSFTILCVMSIIGLCVLFGKVILNVINKKDNTSDIIENVNPKIIPTISIQKKPTIIVSIVDII